MIRKLDEKEHRSVSIFEIALSSGKFCYAIWIDPLLVFLDIIRDKTADKSDAHIIAKSPILFKIGVDILWRRRWRRIGIVFVPKQYCDPVDFARHDISNGKMSIYTRIPLSNKFSPGKARYFERLASKEECRSLEPLISWSPKAVEDRLELHFQGQESPILQWFWSKVL